MIRYTNPHLLYFTAATEMYTAVASANESDK